MSEQTSSEEGVEIRVFRAATMTEREHVAAFEVFDASYREADYSYLERSIERIGMLSIAFVDGRPGGYAISNFRWMDLPGFAESQLVMLHGMRCVIPPYRHRGLSGRLNQAVDGEMRRELLAGGRTPERQLNCGRWGHASRAGGRSDPGAVPRAGQIPTQWQQSVGLMVAEAYGSKLDPTTFVCIGSGTPIGYPNEEFEATEAERAAYALVNRDRGDNLLVINWTPDPPPGWVDPD